MTDVREYIGLIEEAAVPGAAENATMYAFLTEFAQENPEFLDAIGGIPDFIRGLTGVRLDSGQPGQSERLQFYLGGSGTGAPLHYHGNAVNLLAHGRKRWFLLPPAAASFSRRPAAQWLEKEYPALAASSTPPLELVQEGGDVLFVPAGWAHSTLNVEVSVGVVHDNWRVPLIDSCEADKMTRVQ